MFTPFCLIGFSAQQPFFYNFVDHSIKVNIADAGVRTSTHRLSAL